MFEEFEGFEGFRVKRVVGCGRTGVNANFQNSKQTSEPQLVRSTVECFPGIKKTFRVVLTTKGFLGLIS